MEGSGGELNENRRVTRPCGTYILVDVMTILTQRAQRLQLIRKRQELFRELEEISWLPKR